MVPHLLFQVVAVDSVWIESSPHRAVHIFDCIWELFVLVGAEHRGGRDDIRLALNIATVRFDLRTRIVCLYCP